MEAHYEIAIIKTDPDGRRHAIVLADQPRKGQWFGVGFLYRYLRETRRKDAPPAFQFSVIEDDIREWAADWFKS